LLREQRDAIDDEVQRYEWALLVSGVSEGVRISILGRGYLVRDAKVDD